ncbi:MAG: hypothetical protein EXR95_05465 [Gemmatimonadetes bacterium]|nr:hypothetical protein [Gemmatimonadota bacterium]
MAPGGNHTCGLTTSGSAYCWGFNGWGAIGNGTLTPTNFPTPQAVVGGHTFKSLTAGYDHSCGVTIAGGAYCWGKGGQLADGATNDQGQFFSVDRGVSTAVRSP